MNKTLQSKLADKSAKDVLVLFSQIIGEAVDEGLIGSNPCRKLRIAFADSPERPHAGTNEVDAIARRMHPDDGLLTITAAYTGLRWGELGPGRTWTRTHASQWIRSPVHCMRFGDRSSSSVRRRLQRASVMFTCRRSSFGS